MAEHLCELAAVLSWAAMIRIFGVSLYKLFKRRRLFVVKGIYVQQMHVCTHLQGGLQQWIICLPRYNLKVSAVKIHVKECITRIRTKHTTDVRQIELHRLSGGSFTSALRLL